MKPHVTDLPLDVITRLAKAATQRAAREAVRAGRTVAGWKEGGFVECEADNLSATALTDPNDERVGRAP